MAKENKFFIYDSERRTTLMTIIKYGILAVEGVCYDFLVRVFHPKYEKKTYGVSICAIFKNESQYLKEWIEYHLLIGVDHFYLYNNNSEDNYIEVLADYIKKGSVTLIDWPYNQAQMQAYCDCIEKYKSDSNWIGFIDIDEFVVPRKQNSIYDVMEKYKIFPAIVFYWRLFGTSGRIDRNKKGLVIEDFVCCWEKYDEVGKCFYNTAYAFDFSFKRNKCLHHYMWAKYKFIYYPPFNVERYSMPRKYFNRLKSDDLEMQINHYFTKSYNEYLEKKAKGDVYFKINPHDEEYFYRHEMNCLSTDYSIFKYIIRLKKRMELDC